MDEYVLKKYYIKYLKEIRGVSDSTVKHYQEALKYISKYLVEKGKLQQTVYEIQDIEILENVKKDLYADMDFKALDKRGHQMYTAGFNNYYKFASGGGFTNMHQGISIMDTEIPVDNARNINQTVWKRSSIIKLQSIESAGYQCEINPAHMTFTAKRNNLPYMEGHHALPMRVQNMFTRSLDVYANIVCVCPICHRLLHYGVDLEKEDILGRIYYDRADRLAVSGIRISKSDFMKLCM